MGSPMAWAHSGDLLGLERYGQSLSLGSSTSAPGNLELSPSFGPDLLHYPRYLLQPSGLHFPSQ